MMSTAYWRFKNWFKKALLQGELSDLDKLQSCTLVIRGRQLDISCVDIRGRKIATLDPYENITPTVHDTFVNVRLESFMIGEVVKDDFVFKFVVDLDEKV